MEEDKNYVGIKDEIGKEIIESQKESLKVEIQTFEEGLKNVLEAKKNYEDQWLVDKEVYELLLEGDNLKSLNPTQKFQTIDRYWELQKLKLQYKYREDKFLAEQRLKGYDEKIKEIQEKLELAKKTLQKIEETEEVV